MILYLTQSVFIITLFYMMYYALFKRFTFFNFNRAILLVGIGLALILPALPLNFSPEQTEYVYLPQEALNGLNHTTTSVVESNWWQEMTVLNWITLAYWIGFSIFFINMLFQLGMVFWMMRKGESEHKEGVKLIFTNKDVSPFSFFSNIIVNPEQVNQNQWNDVIVHEKVHINQWHQFDVVLAELLKTALWFLPISWWYAKDIRTNLEYIADDISLRNGLNRKNYQLSLVQISQQNAGPQLVNSFSKKIIKNRIKMLNTMKSNKNAMAAYSIILPLMLALSFIISTQAQAQEKKVKQVIVVTEDGKTEDVKVTYKDENGETVEVNADDVRVIESSDNEHVKIEMKNGSDISDIIVDVDTEKIVEESLKKGANVDVLRKVIKLKDGKTKIVELDSSNNDTITVIVNGKKIELGDLDSDKFQFHFDENDFEFDLDSMNIDIEKVLSDIDFDGMTKAFVFPEGKHSNEFFFHLDDNNLNISEEDYNKLSKKQKRQLDKIRKELEKNKKNGKTSARYFFPTDNNKHPLIISSSTSFSDKEPLVVIDGKVSSHKEMNELDPKRIKSMNVLKGSVAIEKYGKKAKDGVIEIITKKAGNKT